MNNYTLQELKDIAKSRGLVGYSRLRKNELYNILYPAAKKSLTPKRSPKRTTSTSKNYSPPQTFKRPIKRQQSPKFKLSKCGMSVFENYSGICGFNAAIVALFFCDRGREILWPITFKFESADMIPVQLNTWDDDSPFHKLNNIAIILEIIRGNIQLSLEASQKYGPYDKLQTFHEWVDICNVQSCSFATQKILCSISKFYKLKLCDSDIGGVYTFNILKLLASYYDNLFAITEWSHLDNTYAETKGEAFVIRIGRDDSDAHAISVFKCNNHWFYYDNCSYIKLSYKGSTRPFTSERASFNDILKTDIDDIIRYKGWSSFKYTYIACINFNNYLTFDILLVNNNTIPNFWDSLSPTGKDMFIDWLNGILYIEDDKTLRDIYTYIIYRMYINLLYPKIFDRLDQPIKQYITQTKKRTR